MNRIKSSIVAVALAATVLSAAQSASAAPSPAGPADTAASTGPSELGFGSPTGVTATRYSGKGGNAVVFTLKPGQDTLVIPIDVPPGGSLIKDSTGGMRLMVGGAMVGYIYQPWARDAAGRMLATSYSWNGRQLIQHVDLSGARFPVQADPHYTCSWTGCEVQFNKHETQVLAYGSTVASWVPWLTIAGRYMWVWAAIALAQGKCIKIRNALWVYIYSGGYCR